LFMEACKDHVRSIKKDETSDHQKKSQNSFVLKDAIDKHLAGLERSKQENELNPRGLS